MRNLIEKYKVQAFKLKMGRAESSTGVELSCFCGSIFLFLISQHCDFFSQGVDWILNEEHRYVVADHIVVARLSVKLDGKAARAMFIIVGAALACSGGEANENGVLFLLLVVPRI